MPLKKKRKRNTGNRSYKASKSSNKRSRFAWADKWMQSYSSFLLGIVVVIVAVLFVVSVIRQQTHIQQTSSLSTGPTPTATQPTPGVTIVEGDKTYYIVKTDDSLWSIAENIYNDGYQWVKIAQANNLSNPSTIFTGNKLLLPDAPKPSELGQMLQNENAQTNAITGNSYTVQQGDSLWDIAVRAYADGYSWTKIAQANTLTNPNLIFSGNVLTIPR